MSAFIVSTSTWEEVPKEYRAALKEAVRKAEGKFIAVQQQSDREYLEKMRAEGSTLVKLTPAELRTWEETFSRDAEKMANIPDSVINGPFYRKITALLEKYRAKNGQ